MTKRVVVDTNVFVAALKSADGASREVIRRCLLKDMFPLMGLKLFLEYEDVLNRPNRFDGCPVSQQERAQLLFGFLSVCQWVSVMYLWRPNLPDEGDNHVLELAVAGSANRVITHNFRDFRGELHFPEIRVVTPAQFLKEE